MLKSWLFRLIVLMLGLTVSLSVFAESLCLDYDLQVFVQESLKQDSGFTKDLQTYIKAKYNRISTHAMASWLLAGSAGINHIESDGSSVFQPTKIDVTSYELSLQKLFLSTGTRVTLGHSQSSSRNQYSTQANAFGSGFLDTSDTVHEQDVSLVLVQPLLKNAFGLADRFPVQAAEFQQQAAQIDVEEAWENRLADLYGAYLDWAAAYESTLALRSQKTEIEKVVKLVELKYQARVAEKTDWLRVLENQLQVQNQLAQAENQLDATAAKAGILRLGKILTSDELRSLAPKLKNSLQECEADFVRPIPSLEELRILKRLVVLSAQLEAQMKVAENAQLPQVDLLGTAASKGRGTETGTMYPPLNQKDYSVRLQAQYPIGNPKAQGDLGQAQAGLTELSSAQQLAKRDLTLALWQMKRTLQTLQTVTQNNQALVKLAEEKLELNMRNYRIGRVDTFLLLDSVNALITARLQEVQSAIQFKRLLVTYLSLTDRLLPKHPDLLESLRLAQEGN